MSRDAAFPPYRQVGIAGVGLIGGSVALAIRDRWPNSTVIGCDREEVLHEALTRDVIHEGYTRVEELRRVDLLVLATPVQQNLECLRRLSARVTQPIVVTDVGSTKREIVALAKGMSAALRFVAGHPLAGGEHGGMAHARPDLFRGRPWVLTPTETTDAAALAGLTHFVRETGAEPRLLDPAVHDRLMAYVSHLPQLTASTLMQVIGDAVGASGLTLSGAGLADTTRLAASPSNIWTEICQSNNDHLGEALDELISMLQYARAHLADSGSLARFLDAGRTWRETLIRRADADTFV